MPRSGSRALSCVPAPGAAVMSMLPPSSNTRLTFKACSGVPWRVLHGDNGSTLKATTVLAMLNWLGVKPSGER